MHVSSYRSIRSSKYYVIYQKKAKDAEIIAAKAAEEAKAAEGIQEAPKVELVKCPKCGREVEKEE